MVLLYNKASQVLKTKDFSKLFLWGAKYFLEFGVMWPFQKSQLKKNISFLIHSVALIFVCSGLLLYARKNSHDFNKATFALCTLCLPVLAVFKICFIWYKSKDLTTIFDYIFKNFWPYDVIEAGNMEFILKSFKYQSIFILIFGAGGVIHVILGCLMPLVQKGRTLIFFCDYPFDWTISPIYECIYVIQVFTLGFSIWLSITGLDFFVLGILLGSANQYCILQHCFSVFNTNKMEVVIHKMRVVLGDQLEKKYDDEKEFFVRLVRHHQMLLRCTNRISDIFSPMELSHLLFSVYSLCFGSWRMATVENPSFADSIIFPLWVLGSILQILMDCLCGTILYYQASLLPSAIFESNWVNLKSKELKKDIRFMIQHTQRIPQFSAYNLYDLNMISFGKVLKLAFSMYTVLSSLGK